MARGRTTRREFLRQAAGFAGAAGVVGLSGCPGGILLPINDGFAATAILRSPDYGPGLVDVIEQGLQLVPPPDVAGKRVLLKPNLVDLPREGRPAVTNPAVIVAASEAFRRRGAAEVLVGDGPALQRDAYEIIDASGLTPLLDEHGLPFLDLNLDDVVRLSNAGGTTGLGDLFFASSVVHADVLVSMPKLKTHHWAGASLASKNMFGATPAAVYGWPRNRFHLRDLHKVVFDLNRTRSPDYCIVDGVTAMEGDGPVRGTAKDVGVLVFGDNATAVDATCARVMRLRPDRIDYLRLAAGILGPIQEGHIEQRGEAIAAVASPFAVVEHLNWLRA